MTVVRVLLLVGAAMIVLGYVAIAWFDDDGSL